MWPNWKSWCRLCGKHESSSFVKTESITGLTENTERYLLTVLADLENGPDSICPECHCFISQLGKFDERCVKVKKMFYDLIKSGTTDISDNDAQILVYKHGIDIEDKLVSLLKQDQTTDTFDLVDNETTAAEEEDVPDPPITTRRRRGRSRKNENENEKAKEDVDIKKEETEYKTIEIEIESYDYDNDDFVNDPSFTVENEEFDLENEAFDIISDEQEVKKSVTKKKRTSPKKKVEKQIYACDLCNIEFTREKEFDAHMRNSHTPDELPFACAKCPKRFTTLAKVQRHENVHLPDNMKLIHPCSYCDKRFSKAVNVQAHIRAIHIGDRPFICEGCGKSFVTKGALKEHQITHSDESPFQCSQCPKKFKNMARLRTHEDIHKDTMYVCPHCGLQLNTKRTLKMHMVVHSDQKKYKCHYCGGQFKRSKALKNHLILHTGLRPYTCPFCEKTFANGSNCRSHKKKAHPNELAALEASGQALPAANIPKLEHLQPKVLPAGQITIEDAMEAINNDNDVNLEIN